MHAILQLIIAKFIVAIIVTITTTRIKNQRIKICSRTRLDTKKRLALQLPHTKSTTLTQFQGEFPFYSFCYLCLCLWLFRLFLCLCVCALGVFKQLLAARSWPATCLSGRYVPRDRSSSPHRLIPLRRSHRLRRSSPHLSLLLRNRTKHERCAET